MQLRIYLDMIALTWNDDARAILAYVACSERNRAQDRTLPIFTRARQKRAAKAKWAIAICQGFLRATQTTFLTGPLGPSSTLVVIWCCVEENNVAMYEGVASSLGHNGDQETVKMCLKAPLAQHHHADRSYFS